MRQIILLTTKLIITIEPKIIAAQLRIAETAGLLGKTEKSGITNKKANRSMETNICNVEIIGLITLN